MRVILYIGHGSRNKEATRQAQLFYQKLMTAISVSIQELAFLELAAPSIQDGVKSCVEKGATHIVIVPLLLLEAGHAKQDIPLTLDRMQRKYPFVQFSYAKPIGVHESIIDMLYEKIKQQITHIEETFVLLIGRGSSDAKQISDMRKIGTMLETKYPFKTVETCFLVSAAPDLKMGLQMADKADAKQICVLPYILFTGHLFSEIKKECLKLEKFQLCEPLGYHHVFKELIKKRIAEATTYDERKAL